MWLGALVTEQIVQELLVRSGARGAVRPLLTATGPKIGVVRN